MQIYHRLCDAGVELTNCDIRKTKRRNIEIVRLRYAIGNLLLTNYGLSTVEVGRLMNKDHTTIVYYRKYHRGRYRSDDEYAQLFDRLQSKMVDEKAMPDDLEEVIGCIKLIAQ